MSPVHQRTDDRSESPKKSKGKLFATIACLLAVLIGGVSYYQYEYVPNQRLKAQEGEHAARVSALLSGAEEDLARDRLTSPAGANAWEKYQAVLALEPGHKKASAGLDSIIGRKDCAECPEMVVVPSGSFTMGSSSGEDGRHDDEGPRHRVNIGYPLAVGVYEVTFSEWDACVNAGGCGGHRPEDRGWG